MGRVVKGTISIVKAGFGFIDIDSADSTKPGQGLPRIYFKKKDFTDEKFRARRGYLVTFKVTKDEEGKSYASEIKLTAEGQLSALKINEAIVKRKEEAKVEKAQNNTDKKLSPNVAESSGESTTGKPKRPRRIRKTVERIVKIKVTCEGKKDEIMLDLNLRRQTKLGQVKAIACKTIDAPLNYSIYSRTSEDPDIVFFTKAILNKLKDGDHLHLKEAPEKEDPPASK